MDGVGETAQLFNATFVGKVTAVGLIVSETVKRSSNLIMKMMRGSTIDAAMNNTDNVSGSAVGMGDGAPTEGDK